MATQKPAAKNPATKAPSAAVGYSSKSLIDKLGLKEGSKAIVIAPPANYGDLTDNAAITPKKTAPPPAASTSSTSS